MASFQGKSSGLRAASGLNHAAETSSSGNHSEAKFCASEVEGISDRLRTLEEEAEAVKQAFVESVEERRKLLIETSRQFQVINRHLRSRKQFTGDISSDGRAATGLSQVVLHQESNPSLVIRHLRATMGAFDEPANRGNRPLSFHQNTTTTRSLLVFMILRPFAKQTPIPPPPLLRRLLQYPNQPTAKPMEVEVKLRLPDAVSHQTLSDLLSPFHTKTLIQENVFFDGANAELSSNLAALRLRFYHGGDSQCVVSLKAKPVISAGISRVEEDEEPIDTSIARACVAEPWRLLRIDSSRVLKRVREEFGIGNKGLVCLGGFRNVRNVFDWEGLKLELDETRYDFGTSYEIECESSDPDQAKKLIEEFLNGNGIRYSYSEVSKFAVFRSGKLPQ